MDICLQTLQSKEGIKEIIKIIKCQCKVIKMQEKITCIYLTSYVTRVSGPVSLKLDPRLLSFHSGKMESNLNNHMRILTSGSKRHILHKIVILYHLTVTSRHCAISSSCIHKTQFTGFQPCKVIYTHFTLFRISILSIMQTYQYSGFLAVSFAHFETLGLKINHIHVHWVKSQVSKKIRPSSPLTLDPEQFFIFFFRLWIPIFMYFCITLL